MTYSEGAQNSFADPFVYCVFFQEDPKPNGSVNMKNITPKEEFLLKNDKEMNSKYIEAEIEFYLCFHNWIDSHQSFSKIHEALQSNAKQF